MVLWDKVNIHMKGIGKEYEKSKRNELDGTRGRTVN
jgi:hypothetical protein